MPAATASSTAYWTSGRSTTGSISFGTARVMGSMRVPSPATGNTAFDTRPVIAGPRGRRALARISHRLSSRGRQDAAVTRRTDRKTLKA